MSRTFRRNSTIVPTSKDEALLLAAQRGRSPWNATQTTHASRFSAIRRRLDSRLIRAQARTLPSPYNGMINDVLGAIQTGGNYLAALGLASYTEACGRQIFFLATTVKRIGSATTGLLSSWELASC